MVINSQLTGDLDSSESLPRPGLAASVITVRLSPFHSTDSPKLTAKPEFVPATRPPNQSQFRSSKRIWITHLRQASCDLGIHLRELQIVLSDSHPSAHEAHQIILALVSTRLRQFQSTYLCSFEKRRICGRHRAQTLHHAHYSYLALLRHDIVTNSRHELLNR